jgi:hypothetical protein
MSETTLPDLVADLVALRHAGGYRFKVQERVLRQFADHCRQEGYPDGSITKEVIDGFPFRKRRCASLMREGIGRRATSRAFLAGTPRSRSSAWSMITAAIWLSR